MAWLFRAAGVYGDESCPLAVIAQHGGGEDAMVVALEFGDFLKLGDLARLLWARAFGFQREDLSRGVHGALILPQITVHRIEPRPDVLLLLRIVAKREDMLELHAHHLGTALAQDPKASDGTHSFCALGFHGRFSGLHDDFGLGLPVSNELLEPCMLLGRWWQLRN